MKYTPDNYRQAHLFPLLDILRDQDNIDINQIKLLGSGQLTFPASDIADVFVDHNRHAVILLNVLCLTSIDTCLPLYFYDIIRSDEGKKLKIFIDRMTQSIIFQFYRLWQQPKLIPPSDFSSIQSKRQLQNMFLRIGYCDAVDISEFLTLWQPTTNRTTCDYMNVLGDTAVLGGRCLSSSASIAITMTIESDVHQAVSLLPTSHMGQQIQSMLAIFLRPCLKYKMIINVLSQKNESLVVGGASVVLGQFCAIGYFSRKVNQYVHHVEA